MRTLSSRTRRSGSGKDIAASDNRTATDKTNSNRDTPAPGDMSGVPSGKSRSAARGTEAQGRFWTTPGGSGGLSKTPTAYKLSEAAAGDGRNIRSQLE